MRMLKITKTFETIEDLNSSAEYSELYSGVVFRAQKDCDEVKFHKAFQVEDGRLMIIREMINSKDAGLRILSRLSATSCLNNAPFMLGFVSDDEFLMIEEEQQYDRSNYNRIQFAGHCSNYPKCFVTTTI